MKDTKLATKFIQFSLTLFLISAVFACCMRLHAVLELPFLNYSRFLQTHSHSAFLGWAYIGVTVLLNFVFLPQDKAFTQKYRFIFSVELVLVVLMLISFPLQGYKGLSIALLSLFIVASYVHSFYFLKDFKHTRQNLVVSSFLKFSIYYYVLSTLATWSLGGIVATQGKGDLYYNAIYFYLHFLYNGFFVFALFGLVFRYFEAKKVHFSNQKARLFFYLLNLACLPAYVLSMLNFDTALLQLIALVAASLQLLALGCFFRIVQKLNFKQLSLPKTVKILFLFVFVAFILKILLQFGTAFPALNQQISIFKSYFVIGYLHLVTLGIISTLLFVFLGEYGLIQTKNVAFKIGIRAFVVGLLLSEFLLFSEGLCMGVPLLIELIIFIL